jgi:hypothetical protein
MLHRALSLLAAFGALSACGGEPVAPPVAPRPSATPAIESAAPVAEAEPAPSAAPSAAATAEPAGEAAPAPPPVGIVQVAPAAPPAKLPSIAILAPAKNAVLPAAKAKGAPVKLRVSGASLGAAGHHLCVSIDKHPCRRVVDLAAPLTLGELDPTLDEGQHVLSAFVRRDTNESVKPAGKAAPFASISFFVGKRSVVWKDGGPMLFVSVPDEGPAPAEGPLVDVYGANFDMANGYRLHMSVAGPGLENGAATSVSTLAPFRLRGARPGEYLVRFSLFHMEPTLGPSGSSTTVTYASRPVAGPFAEITRTFRVTAAR